MIPNLLTLARVLLTAPLVWLLLSNGAYHRWAALCVFLLAGVTDLLDGWLARRLGEASPFGAMFDLFADRLLTLVLAGVLLANGELGALGAVAALVLVARDLAVAGLNEALPGRLDIRVGALERIKIACQFLGFGFLIMPNFPLPDVALPAHVFGAAALVASALLALATLADYGGRARKAFRAQA